MSNGAWRERLRAAYKSSGKSKRSISIEAGAGAGYLHSILEEGKQPTVEKLLAICDVIPVSGPYILYGINVSNEDMEILKALSERPASRSGILALLKSTEEVP